MAVGTTSPDFDEIFSSFRPRLIRYLSRLVGAGHAEDVAQEVFLRVSRALPGFRGEAKLSTWVYAIATNTALDHLRRPEVREARRVGHSGEGAEASLETSAPAHGGPVSIEDAAIRSEMRACIREMVATLPASYRVVLALSDFEGFSDKEIAATLGVSLGAAKIRLHRARAALRTRLGDACRLYRNETDDLRCDRLPPAPPPQLVD